MKPGFQSVVIFVKDMNTAVKFYKDLLELEVMHDFGLNISFSCGIALWQVKPDHEITQRLINHEKKKNHSVELYFESVEFETTVQRMKDAAVRIFHDVKEESWGQRTIRFFDPDENLIEIGETMKAFLSRLSCEMTLEEVETKTGVKIQDIKNMLSSD